MSKVYIVTSEAITYNAGGETLNAWVEGQKINDPVEFARYLRAVTKETDGVDLSQTDERIVEVVEGITDEEDMIIALVEDSKASLGKADYSKSDGVAVPNETLVTLKSSAAVIAAKLDDVSDMLDSMAAKSEELKYAVRDILFGLRKALNDQGMMGLPIPGTTAKETDHYDRYKYTAKDIATNKNKTVQGSVIKDIELTMKGGKDLEGLIASYKKANARQPDAPAHISKLSVSERTTMLKMLTNRQAYRRKTLASAIRLWHMFTDINAVAPGHIVLSFIMSKDAEGNEHPVNREMCMVLVDRKNEHETEFLTIPQVMTYKPSWCTPENIKAEGGAWNALAVSASRSAPKPEATGFKSNEDMINAFTLAVQRLDDRTNTNEFIRFALDKKNTGVHLILGDLFFDLKAYMDQGGDKLYMKAQAAANEVEAEASKAAAAKLAAQHNKQVAA